MSADGAVRAALSAKQLLVAVALVSVAALILGASQFLIGPNTAASGYLTILFLLSIIRAGSWRARLFSVGWSLAIAALGFAVGGLGLWVTLAAVVFVCLVQAFVTVGETAFLTRSPVNLLAFAALSQSGAELWQAMLGSAIGAGVVVGFAALVKARAHAHDPGSPLVDRIAYGAVTAGGSFLIVFASELLEFPYRDWTLLSFSVILAVGADQRARRGYLRVLGSVAGVLLAMLASMLPQPIPLVLAGLFLVLCVAYVNAGEYALFVLFLTPAILLTAATELSTFALGVYRLEAVLFATLVALLGGLVMNFITRRSGGGEVIEAA
ncbi:FUSC family protein [Pseudoclavibacter sp. VKM Ac-2888]|uniref:FUSC family protein n=1 Tax=Pseudoclavibacter sp. VKM Ac-2888 TaxID=2783830 RepID=UPI00188D314D|nr:FUSC family protein [Pseudoclavibacter sp. VKM Ac-2888]MBF4551281.1 FUSC family protein [Pseudoclavibacter sp. VKM Ac-2888]